MMGVVFKRPEIENVDGLPVTVALEEFQVTRQALVYTTIRYDRWRFYKERLAQLLTPLLKAALTGASVAQLRLEYRDRFYFTGESRVAKVSELLREGCDLIAPHVFAREDLWHSHTGMFLPADGVERRLVQIQIDASDAPIAETEGVRRSVSLITGVQDFLEAEQTKEQQANDIGNQFDALHIASKRLFQDMITEAARTRIGLLN